MLSHRFHIPKTKPKYPSYWILQTKKVARWSHFSVFFWSSSFLKNHRVTKMTRPFFTTERDLNLKIESIISFFSLFTGKLNFEVDQILEFCTNYTLKLKYNFRSTQIPVKEAWNELGGWVESIYFTRWRKKGSLWRGVCRSIIFEGCGEKSTRQVC